MKRVAIFVGIDKYKNGITSLNCAVSDAKALTSAFAREQFDSVESLLNEEAHCETILEQVEKTILDLEAGDLFVFYFSGHGREVGNNHYLLGTSARSNAEFYQRGSLSISELIAISNKPGINRLFILDCCRSNLLADRDGAFSTNAARDISLNKAVTPGADHTIIPPLIINSCSTGERAFEDLNIKHGFFTSALLKSVDSADIHSFPQFMASLKIVGTPMPQNICWNGNLQHWSSIPLFKKWSDTANAPSDADVSGDKDNSLSSATNFSEDCTVSNDVFQEEKECPWCGERIKAKAKICRFCQHDVSSSVNPPAEQKSLTTFDEKLLTQTTFELFPGERLLSEKSVCVAVFPTYATYIRLTNFRLVMCHCARFIGTIGMFCKPDKITFSLPTAYIKNVKITKSDQIETQLKIKFSTLNNYYFGDEEITLFDNTKNGIAFLKKIQQWWLTMK